MTKFLVSEENKEGMKLEDILHAVRADIVTRCTLITGDSRPEARQVLNNNIKILSLLSDAMSLAEDSTHNLDRAFGPSQSVKGGLPRIGN